MQGNLLSQIKGAAHIIKLLAKAQCSYHEKRWHALLVAPFLQRPNHKDDLTLFGQVCRAYTMAQSKCINAFDLCLPRPRGRACSSLQ